MISDDAPPANAHERPADADRVHVTVLLDRSGSMSSIVDDTIGGFNSFVAQQRRVPGECRITLVQFDGQETQYVVADAIPVAEFTDLDAGTYQPRGTTPLLDALGAVIERTDGRAVVDPAEFQLVAVITDGHENASARFTRARVAAMVEARTEAGWAFVFLGANLDSFAEAGSIGMTRGQAANWDHTSAGVRRGFDMLAASSVALRKAGRRDRHAMRRRLLDDVRADSRRDSSA